LFKDLRTGPNTDSTGKVIDIAVRNSGFDITYTDTFQPLAGGGGRRTIVVKQIGQAVNGAFDVLDGPAGELPNVTWTETRKGVQLASAAGKTSPAAGLENKLPS
jgi:hypothetical protein